MRGSIMDSDANLNLNSAKYSHRSDSSGTSDEYYSLY